MDASTRKIHQKPYKNTYLNIAIGNSYEILGIMYIAYVCKKGGIGNKSLAHLLK